MKPESRNYFWSRHASGSDLFDRWCVPRIRPSIIFYLIANFIGLLIWLELILNIVVEAKMEQQNSYDGAEGITFFCDSAPVLFACFLGNLFWMIKALADIFRRRDYRATLALLVVVIAWGLMWFSRGYITALPPQTSISS